MGQPERKNPDDYWKSPGFARRYVINNVNGPMTDVGFREFDGLTFLAQAQGIQYLATRPTSLLDVGCGHAVRGARLGNYFNMPVTGLDYSPAMLEQAKPIMDRLPEDRRVMLVEGDVNDMPFDDGQFDVAVTYGLLMSVPDISRAVREIMRSVKYGLVAIEETEAVMNDVQRRDWERVKDKQFPGRIYWHDYLKAFSDYASVLFTPLRASSAWTHGHPPAYARFIVVKGE